MEFRQLLDKLAKLSLPEDQFVVVGSGPLGARGIRECNDLDVLVSDRLWNKLAQKYPVKKEWGMDAIEVGRDVEMLGEGSQRYRIN